MANGWLTATVDPVEKDLAPDGCRAMQQSQRAIPAVAMGHVSDSKLNSPHKAVSWPPSRLQASWVVIISMPTMWMAIGGRTHTLPLRGPCPRPLGTSGGWCGSSGQLLWS